MARAAIPLRASARSQPYARLHFWVPAAGPAGRATICMSGELPQEFVDTNVLVYAFDASAGSKRAAGQRPLERLWKTSTGCLSLQVLQEFFVTVTRKVPQPRSSEEAG